MESKPSAIRRKRLPRVLYDIRNVLLLFLFIVLCTPLIMRLFTHGGILMPMDTQGRQWAMVIGTAMTEYANRHGGKYPDGKSSTEVFQKLLDGRYLTDSYYFWLPLHGKVRGIRGQKLKPENVCFDVTSSVSSDDPDNLPIVFTTGCKATYAPGSSAIPLVKPFPQYVQPQDTWYQWWNIKPKRTYDFTREQGMSVYYKSKKTTLLPLTSSDTSDGAIPNFIPADFDPKGKTYRQLTPDGALTP